MGSELWIGFQVASEGNLRTRGSYDLVAIHILEQQFLKVLIHLELRVEGESGSLHCVVIAVTLFSCIFHIDLYDIHPNSSFRIGGRRTPREDDRGNCLIKLNLC